MGWGVVVGGVGVVLVGWISFFCCCFVVGVCFVDVMDVGWGVGGVFFVRCGLRCYCWWCWWC